MKTPMKEKPRIVPVTAADEIASIKRNLYGDIIGGSDKFNGVTSYWAYAHSLERWRKSRERELDKHE